MGGRGVGLIAASAEVTLGRFQHGFKSREFCVGQSAMRRELYLGWERHISHAWVTFVSPLFFVLFKVFPMLQL